MSVTNARKEPVNVLDLSMNALLMLSVALCFCAIALGVSELALSKW